jgi:hypothetical protein
VKNERSKRISASCDRMRSFAAFLALVLATLAGVLRAQESDLLVSPGKLSKAHSEYAGLNNCQKCHTPGKKSVDAKCLDCHTELAARIEAGRGFHRDKKTGCPTCHPDHQGPDFPLIDWQPREFVHAKSGYSLKGKHAEVTDCHKCHNARNSPSGQSEVTYLIKSTSCAFCHEDVHKGQFAKDCDACHGLDVPLKELKFDHAVAAYALKGAHQNVPCDKCHPQNKWTGLPHANCLDCHRDPHNPTLGKTCAKCHAETSWKVTSFKHDQTKYPLQGKHVGLRCEQCHRSGKLEKIPFASCRDCHAKDPHQGQFENDCGSCHNVSGFKPATLDHQNTRYPLTGKHASVACAKCHIAKGENAPVLYRPMKTSCVDCHKDAHFGQFIKACEQCHSTLGFDRGTLGFDHQRDSSYKLEGAHAPLKCEACHNKESAPFPAGTGEAVRYRPLSQECVSCHPDFHVGQVGTDCRKCHDVVRFKPASGFAHEKTRFSLKGLHEALACDKCHLAVKITLAGRAVDSPRYKLSETKCADCHKSFDHSTTAYPLTGKHAAVDCGNCHNAKTPHLKRLRDVPEGKFTCKDCHATRHPGKQENCANCHTTKTWTTDRY